MDAFESIIAAILERHGFWVRTSYKVELEPEDKKAIGRPSCPRWEIDVLAYQPRTNLLRIIECKSYLNSHGVRVAAFEAGAKGANKYKLFTEELTWKTVQFRLLKQLLDNGLIIREPQVELCLAAGKIYGGAADELQAVFQARGWHLYGPDWIRGELAKLATSKYENSAVSMTSKILLVEKRRQ